MALLVHVGFCMMVFPNPGYPKTKHSKIDGGFGRVYEYDPRQVLHARIVYRLGEDKLKVHQAYWWRGLGWIIISTEDYRTYSTIEAVNYPTL